MKKFLISLVCIFVSSVAFSQNLVCKWKAYEGSDNTVAHITLFDDNTGLLQLKTWSREEALPYDDGSGFWDEYSISGGYYYKLIGEKSVPLKWSVVKDQIVLKMTDIPQDKVDAEIDEDYSFWDLTDVIEFKHEILARWRWDLNVNEDVRWHKTILARRMSEDFSDLFKELTAATYPATYIDPEE